MEAISFAVKTNELLKKEKDFCKKKQLLIRYLKNREDLNLTNEAPPPAPAPPIIVKCPAFVPMDNQLENELLENSDSKVFLIDP